jgi:hypothetical protein
MLVMLNLQDDAKLFVCDYGTAWITRRDGKKSPERAVVSCSGAQ